MFRSFVICLALAGSAAADPYWEIIAAGTTAQSQTAGSASGAAVLANTRRAYELARGWESRPLGMDDVRALNATLREGQAAGLAGAGGTLRERTAFSHTSGGWERNVYPSSRGLPADAAKLDAYLQRVTSRPLSREQAIRVAADVHSYIVQNHLFGDANGRTARMTADAILMRNGLPPADYAALDPARYNSGLSGTAQENKLAFRGAMEQAVVAAEARAGRPTTLLGVPAAPVPDLTARSMSARVSDLRANAPAAAAWQVGSHLVNDAVRGEFRPGAAVASLVSLEFPATWGGAVLAERAAAMILGRAIPVPVIGPLVGQAAVHLTARASAMAAGASAGAAVARQEIPDWRHLSGSAIATGAGMVIGSALFPVMPVLGGAVGGIVGGLVYDAFARR